MRCKTRIVGVVTGEITAKLPGEADCAVRGESLASKWKEVWTRCKTSGEADCAVRGESLASKWKVWTRCKTRIGGVNRLKLRPS